MRRIIYLVVAVGFSLLLSSCATTPVKPPSYPTKEISPPLTALILRHNIYHAVAPGETLWRLSKMYDVPMQDILKANSLKNKDELEKGQRLLIPNAAPIVPVVPLYPSKKWKYIIIHHSATDEGSSFDFDRYHLSRGWEGVGYHFVIDNGTKGKQDGQIEVSPRWLKQKNGSHCKASEMNNQAIGICLVGNFNTEAVSKKQLDSLTYLVGLLRKYYKIPLARVLGHGQVSGAKTACPGTKFPWKELRLRLED